MLIKNDFKILCANKTLTKRSTIKLNFKHRFN